MMQPIRPVIVHLDVYNVLRMYYGLTLLLCCTRRTLSQRLDVHHVVEIHLPRRVGVSMDGSSAYHLPCVRV
jgi:hypothetical protein